jgi:hypothetical protein
MTKKRKMRLPRRKNDPGGIDRQTVLLDDPDTEGGKHVRVKPGTGSQVFSDDPDMVEHCSRSSGVDRSNDLLRNRSVSVKEQRAAARRR